MTRDDAARDEAATKIKTLIGQVLDAEADAYNDGSGDLGAQFERVVDRLKAALEELEAL